MIKVIIIYLIIIGISILVGLSIRLDWDKSDLYGRTNIKGGICPSQEEYKDVRD